MADKKQNEGRFSRWSKRKLDAKNAKQEEELESSVVKEQVQDEDSVDEREALLLANQQAAEAVDIEAIDKESDISVFMKEGVPELLKKKAMQAMWRSNPIFANVDGLCDYDEDFGRPELNMKVFKSAYTAGKGYAKLLLDDDADKETENAEKPADASTENVQVLEAEEEIVTDEEPVEAEEHRATSKDQIEENEIIGEDGLVNNDAYVNDEPVSPKRVSLRNRLHLES